MTLTDKKRLGNLGNYYYDNDVKEAVLKFENYLKGNIPKFPDTTNRYNDYDLINTNEDLINKFKEIFGYFKEE